MTTLTELKQATSAMAANGFAAAHQATGERAARTSGPMQNGPHPAAEAFARVSHGAAEFGRGNLEVVAQSAQACMTGMQNLSRQYIAAMQGLTQHALEGATTFAAAKTLKDVMAAQASLTHASIERALGEGAKLQQAALTLTQQVYAPLTWARPRPSSRQSSRAA